MPFRALLYHMFQDHGCLGSRWAQGPETPCHEQRLEVCMQACERADTDSQQQLQQVAAQAAALRCAAHAEAVAGEASDAEGVRKGVGGIHLAGATSANQSAGAGPIQPCLQDLAVPAQATTECLCFHILANLRCPNACSLSAWGSTPVSLIRMTSCSIVHIRVQHEQGFASSRKQMN